MEETNPKNRFAFAGVSGINTLCQLTGVSVRDLFTDSENVGRQFLNDPYIQKLIPSMVDYYETEHYIFVHGWISCTPISISIGSSWWME